MDDREILRQKLLEKEREHFLNIQKPQLGMIINENLNSFEQGVVEEDVTFLEKRRILEIENPDRDDSDQDEDDESDSDSRYQLNV